MAELLKGKAVADSITENLIERANALKEKGKQPALAILRLGENEADLSYERNAVKRCEKVGIEVRHFVLPSDVKEEALLDTVKEINESREIDACLVMRPLPQKELEYAVSRTLDPTKDVDCMTGESLSRVFLGRGNAFTPCTPQACIEICDYYGIELEGKNVVIIGRSPVVGKPLAMMLQNRNATVTMCHTKTKDLAGICRGAEILFVAAGKAELVNESMVNNNQIIVDVGINVQNDKLTGDVDFNACEPLVAAITPVPGGVGAVTTSVLAKHVIIAAEYNLRINQK